MVAALAVGFSGVAVLEVAPAEAVTTSVTINRIATTKAPSNGTVRVVPSVTAKGRVKVSKKVLTVKKGTRTLARAKTAVNLRPGTYKVIQKAVYRTWVTKTTTTVAAHKGTIFGDSDHEFVDTCLISSVASNGVDFSLRCSVDRFFDSGTERTWKVTTTGTYDPETDAYVLAGGIDALDLTGAGGPATGAELATTEIKLPADLTYTTTKRVYSATKSKSLTQNLLVRKGPRVRTCATYTDFKRVAVDFDNPRTYGSSMASVRRILHNAGRTSSYSDTGTSVIEFRRYTACTRGAYISVGFENGYAYAKNYSG